MKKNSPLSRSGRFARDPGADVSLFTESISFDRRLWRHDILGSLAHAAMLRKIGVLSKSEAAAIARGLKAIAREIEAGKFRWKPALEDVHMNIEAGLTRRVPAGAKLHTARSRNDQVALDLRLWLRDEIVLLLAEIAELQRALVSLGEKNSGVLIPGYTHLQRAQPVYLAHHLLAYVEMLERDCERLWDCHSRVNVCPLGSGAIAGSTLPLDREFVAKLLGFVDVNGKPQLTQNSMDAVSDRDFAVEFCAAAALLAVHLSRLAEDLILWASAEFNFIKIADAYTTGSSLMPQKKNPDVAELARGKSGRVIGNLVALLTLLKGLPMTYNRDLQEDKERCSTPPTPCARPCASSPRCCKTPKSTAPPAPPPRATRRCWRPTLRIISCARECRSGGRTASSVRSWRWRERPASRSTGSRPRNCSPWTRPLAATRWACSICNAQWRCGT